MGWITKGMATAAAAVALLTAVGPAVVAAQGLEYARVPEGRQPRYCLGVYYDDTEYGVRVTGVTRNSPAWRLGLERGDYITRVNGQRVGIVNGLVFPLANALQGGGRTVELEIWNVRTRDYETHTVELATR